MMYRPNYDYIPPEHWHFLTPFYDFGCVLFGLGKSFRAKVLRTIAIKDTHVVLDVGCGTGVFLLLAKRAYPRARLIGLDPDDGALSIARRRFERDGKHAEFNKGFAEALPFEDGSVDVCCSTLMLHHLPDHAKRAAIREMYRVLKPRGIAVLADFGERKDFFWTKKLLLRHAEYVEGNLNGVIPAYLKEAGFRSVQIVDKHFPAIDIIKVQK